MNDIELLKYKNAIFKMIGQFCHAYKKGNNFYMYTYCESALEAAFTVLGIEEDIIDLLEFCRLREENDRAIWSMNNPNEPYGGATAEDYYELFIDDYDTHMRWLNEFSDSIVE